MSRLLIITLALVLGACSSARAPRPSGLKDNAATTAPAATPDAPKDMAANGGKAPLGATVADNLPTKAGPKSLSDIASAPATGGVVVAHEPIVTANPPAPAPATAPEEHGIIADGQDTQTPILSGGAPAAPAPGVTAGPTDNRNQECGVPYRRDHADWFPGLPFAPLEPQMTLGVDRLGGTQPASTEELRKNPTLGLQYTDAARDNVMGFAVFKAGRRSVGQQRLDRELALKIVDVTILADITSTGTIQTKFNYDLGDGTFAKVELAGQFADKSPKARADVILHQTQSEVNGQFAGRLTCLDNNGGCQNVLLTLQLLTASGQVGREVYVVHRWGNAHLTISDQDQLEADKITNRAHKSLAQYLANTAVNSCVVTLHAAQKGTRQLQACAVERLQKLCGDGAPKFPAARAFSLRTWAVAYGRAGFTFAALDQSPHGTTEVPAHLIIRGPLVISQQRPMATDKLEVSDGLGIGRADLIANDGSGDLNLQLVFSGQPKSHMRLNITSLTETVRPDFQLRAGGGAAEPSWVK